MFCILLFKILFNNCTKVETIGDSSNIPYKPICENQALENMDMLPNEKVNFATSNSEAYQHIKIRVNSIKQNCGSLCDTYLSSPKNNISGGLFYDHVQKHINCAALWNSSFFDEASRFTRAVQKLPTYLKEYFSHNNLIPIKPYYFDNQVNEDRTYDSLGMI